MYIRGRAIVATFEIATLKFTGLSVAYEFWINSLILICVLVELIIDTATGVLSLCRCFKF